MDVWVRSGVLWRASAGECEDGVAHVFLDQIGVDGDGGGGSFAGGSDHLRASVRDVSRDPDAGDARESVSVGDGPSVLVEVAPETDEQVAVGNESRRDEQRFAGDGSIPIELDAAETVILNDDSLWRSLGDADPPRGQLLTLGFRQACPAGVMYTRSSDHWRTIWAYRTAAGEPPSTPSLRSRTSKPWQ